MNGTIGTEHGKLEQNRRKILGNTLAHTVQNAITVSVWISKSESPVFEGFHF